ncbi:MAG: hypothetical protein RR620_05915 [Clostridium sp.]
MKFSNKDKDYKDKVDLKCPICEEMMEEYKYGYDNQVHGKVYFKCMYCGHKTAKIL